MTFDERRISPMAAAAAVAKSLQIDISLARGAIAKRAGSGVLVATAESVWGFVPDDIAIIPESRVQIVWPFFWNTAYGSDIDNPLWLTGDIEFLWNDDPQNRPFRMFGITFRVSDIAAITNGAVLPPANDNTPGSRLMPVEISPRWDWESAFASLLVVSEHPDGLRSISGFDPPRRGSQAALEKWFMSYFAERDPHGHAPSESECRRRAKLVLEAIATLSSPSP